MFFGTSCNWVLNHLVFGQCPMDTLNLSSIYHVSWYTLYLRFILSWLDLRQPLVLLCLLRHLVSEFYILMFIGTSCTWVFNSHVYGDTLYCTWVLLFSCFLGHHLSEFCILMFIGKHYTWVSPYWKLGSLLSPWGSVSMVTIIVSTATRRKGSSTAIPRRSCLYFNMLLPVWDWSSKVTANTAVQILEIFNMNYLVLHS